MFGQVIKVLMLTIDIYSFVHTMYFGINKTLIS